MKKKSLGDDYIEHYPKFKKWINECVCCHRKGYNPNIPDQISAEGDFGSYFIKKYFAPLSLDKDGYCDVCAKFKKK